MWLTGYSLKSANRRGQVRFSGLRRNSTDVNVRAGKIDATRLIGKKKVTACSWRSLPKVTTFTKDSRQVRFSGLRRDSTDVNVHASKVNATKLVGKNEPPCLS